MMTIFEDYKRIMEAEKSLSGKAWQVPDAKELAFIVTQLAHIAKNSLVLRSYNLRYGLTKRNVAFESVGGHTNLVSALIDRALSEIYGEDFEFVETPDGYSYREIIEAVRRHDLPENETGDIPDNGNRDEAEKLRLERLFQKKFSHLSPRREAKFEKSVCRLLKEMDEKSSETGRLLFLADKTAALFMTLCYDDVGHPPLMKQKSRHASNRDREEMALCDRHENHACYASEMWAIDYFKMRSLIDFDDAGFFTAVIVTYTLMINKRWYEWRERDYLN